MKTAYLDFEFNRTRSRTLNLVCSSVLWEEDDGKFKVKNFWLHESKKEAKKLARFLSGFDHLVAWSAVAECRSIIAIEREPLDWEWTDLFFEYRMLTNHNHKLQYGKQLVDGKVRNTRPPPPKWERTDQDKAKGFKPTHSLAEATYKLCGEIRDTDHKNKMRDLIISDPPKFSKKEKEAILAYCEEDVRDLPRIHQRIEQEFRKLRPSAKMDNYRKEAKWRGRYAAHTAWMENDGYPINVEAARNFSAQIPEIFLSAQRDINSQFPEGKKPFKWNRAKQRFSKNTKVWKDHIRKNHDISRWPKTDGKDISLSLESWEKFYDFKHSYPRGNFGAQIVRFLKLQQSLYGFNKGENSKRKGFWDYVGEDGFVRPYMNPFGAQSSRSQPASSGFLFLKPAWVRVLLEPPKGKFCASIDYGSEEFFISGIRSGDKNMIQAYLSGDPYLAFGKQSRQIPPNGTKESHGTQRNACKSTVLGISYLMSMYGLAAKLSADTGRKWTEEEAQEQIDLFNDTFRDYYEYQQDIIDFYQRNGYLRTPCGWYIFGDNDNHRSYANFDIQGAGASVMRKAVDLYYRKTGEHVMFTLHDALYIMGDIGQEEKLVSALRDAMREAFVFYAPERHKKVAEKIRLDPFLWGGGFRGKEGEISLGGEEGWKVPVSEKYIDDRSMSEYEKFKKYFKPSKTSLL